MAITIAKLSTISTLDSTQFSKGLGKMRTDIGAFSAVSFGAFNRVGGMVADFARRAATALPRMVMSSLRAGDALNDLATELGFSTEKLANLQRVAGLSGIDDLRGMLGKMNAELGEATTGNTAAAKSFTDLGLRIEHLTAMKPEQVFERVLDSLKAIPGTAARSAAAMKVFGRSGRGVLRLTDMGSAGLNAEMSNTRRLGLARKPSELAAMGRAADAIDDMKNAAKGAADQLSITLSPAITKLADTIRDKIASLTPNVKNIAPVMKSLPAMVGASVFYGIGGRASQSAPAGAGIGPPTMSNFRRQAQLRQEIDEEARTARIERNFKVFGPPNRPLGAGIYATGSAFIDRSGRPEAHGSAIIDHSEEPNRTKVGAWPEAFGKHKPYQPQAVRDAWKMAFENPPGAKPMLGEGGAIGRFYGVDSQGNARGGESPELKELQNIRRLLEHRNDANTLNAILMKMRTHGRTGPGLG